MKHVLIRLTLGLSLATGVMDAVLADVVDDLNNQLGQALDTLRTPPQIGSIEGGGSATGDYLARERVRNVLAAGREIDRIVGVVFGETTDPTDAILKKHSFRDYNEFLATWLAVNIGAGVVRFEDLKRVASDPSAPQGEKAAASAKVSKLQAEYETLTWKPTASDLEVVREFLPEIEDLNRTMEATRLRQEEGLRKGTAPAPQ